MTTQTPTRLAVVLTAAFWQAAGARALRTVLVALLPFLAPLIGGDWTAVGQAGLAIALAAVLSIATSWASLPELGDGARSRWAALFDRSARTFGQTLAATIGSSLVWSDVDWRLTLVQAGTAAITTAILAIVEQLPETVSTVAVRPTGAFEEGDRVCVRAMAKTGTVRAVRDHAGFPVYVVELDGEIGGSRLVYTALELDPVS